MLLWAPTLRGPGCRAPPPWTPLLIPPWGRNEPHHSGRPFFLEFLRSESIFFSNEKRTHNQINNVESVVRIEKTKSGVLG